MSAIMPEVYDPATDSRVSLEDAIAFYISEYGLPKAKAEFSVKLRRFGSDNITETRMPDGSITVQES